jgi:hypothetical protein
VDVNLRFNWRSASSTGKAAGPAFRLGPYETRRIDVAALQAGNTIPKEANWASVILTTNGLPDEVVAVSASYDQTLQYGAQTPFSDQLALHWAGSLWEYDAQHNSLITAGNGGTKPFQAGFTIYYNQGMQKYELEQSLQPDEQMWIDVGKLIREHVPDKNGNVLPANLASGSYEVRDLTNIGVGNLFEGKVVYDKTYGHVTYGCGLCCAYAETGLWFNPLGIPFLSSRPTGVDGYDTCDSRWVDVSGPFWGHWSTASGAIATVDYYANHTGHAVGSTSSLTYGILEHNGIRGCILQQFGPGGNDNVTPTVTIQGSPTYVYIGQDPTVVQINALFSQGNPSGGSYQWSSPDTSVTFDNPAAEDVHVTATSYSGVINGTQIKVNYTLSGQSANPASVMLTKRIFKFLAGDSVIEISAYNGPNLYGYLFNAQYNVFANPGQQQVTNGSGVSILENVTLQSSNVSFNPNYGHGGLNANSQLLDSLGLTNNTALPANLSIVDSQDLFVGGIYVRNNTVSFTASGVTVKNNGPYN